MARNNLGKLEWNAGNIDRAVKHWMISAGAGYDKPLKEIREGYMKGYVRKEDFERTLRANKEANDEMKSYQRDAWVAYHAAQQRQG